jgi:hypothetical protein
MADRVRKFRNKSKELENLKQQLISRRQANSHIQIYESEVRMSDAMIEFNCLVTCEEPNSERIVDSQMQNFASDNGIPLTGQTSENCGINVEDSIFRYPSEFQPFRREDIPDLEEYDQFLQDNESDDYLRYFEDEDEDEDEDDEEGLFDQTLHAHSEFPASNLLSSELSLAEELAIVYVRTQVHHSAIVEINRVLRKHGIVVPKSARAHLQTIRKVGRLQSGLLHFGIEKGLSTKIRKGMLGNESSKIELQIAIDGLPLSSSSAACFWPILCRVVNSVDSKPFPITVFKGESKPNDLEAFLGPFITEMKDLLLGGVNIDGKHYCIDLKAVICDAPARALMKGIVSHNGYYARERCP